MNFELTQGIDKGLFEEFTASSLKPSNILGIRVDRISEKDEVQKDFFEIKFHQSKLRILDELSFLLFEVSTAFHAKS